MSDTEWRVNDSQSQIDQEESTYENHWQKQYEWEVGVGHLKLDHDVGPPLQRNTLKDNQKCIH